ncbi:MAG: galactosyldiacylglycerol synthase [Caldilineae bacterium]|nr:MAG: galactosyldiacylglycerol synthase [Caldilineae bacterium]
MRKRILFLMSDTGGGHRAAAEAIDEAIHHLYPNTFHTFIEDLWKEHTPWPVNKIPAAYPWMIARGMPVWKLIWLMSTTLKPHKVVLPSVSPVVRRKITRYFREVQPDLIISVHPLMNHLGVKLRDRAGLRDVPFATVVTDMVTVHPVWICPAVTLCTVPTEPARELAIRFGMPPEKVVVTGQPVSLKFAARVADRPALRKKLGLHPERRAVLITGGGEGLGPIFEIARAIARSVPGVELLVVTGRNRQLRRRLEGVPWEVPAHIFGFVRNMPELMGAADLLITKAGPGTISEAFIAGLPLILSGHIPGQETGNVAYVREHRAGAYAEDPRQIAALAAEWLDPHRDTLQQMAKQSAALARPDAALTIARRVCDLV